MKLETFEKGMVLLVSVFPGLKTSLKLWYSLLDDIPDDVFTAAISRIVKTVREVYPTTNMVAMIRELCIDNSVPCLADACNQVRGYLFHSKPAHPLVQKCMRAAGGYDNFNENWDYAMNAFRRLYDDAKEHEESSPNILQLEDARAALKQIAQKVAK